MSSYIRMGARLWESLLDQQGKLKTAFRDEDFDYMEYQVYRWQQALPENLRPELVSPSLQGNECTIAGDRNVFNTRILLYLRANQMRILIQRPILFSPQVVATNQQRIQSLISVARDSIEKLIQADRISDVYKKQQAFHNHFLASALSALFLVAAHQSRGALHGQQIEGGPYSCAAVWKTIFKALDLIGSYSSTSRACRRLLQSMNGPSGLLMGLLHGDENRLVDGSRLVGPQATNPPHFPARPLGDRGRMDNTADLTTLSGAESTIWTQPTTDMQGPDASIAAFFPNIVPANFPFFTDTISGDVGNDLNFLSNNFF